MFVGRSMEPTYQNLEVVVTTRSDGKFQRGDVVVINRPDGTIVKRIAKVPGDSVMRVKGINGWSSILFTPLVRHPKNKDFKYVPVPEGYVYVVGDNIAHSYDSRDFGPVPISSISAEVVNARPPTRNWIKMFTNDLLAETTW